MFVLGWLAVSYPVSPTKIKLFTWHKSIGITILALVLLRMTWRLANPTPSLPSHMKSWQRKMAHVSHALLYVVMVSMPVTGWIINSAANFPLKLYGLILLPSIAPADKSLQDIAELIHLTLFWLLAGLLLLHITGALWHHFFYRDDVLTRMLPVERSMAKRYK